MNYLQKYNDIMERYRNGEFGDEHLSIYEILQRAGEPELLKNLNSSEIQQLIETSSGMTKYMFSNLK